MIFQPKNQPSYRENSLLKKTNCGICKTWSKFTRFLTAVKSKLLVLKEWWELVDWLFYIIVSLSNLFTNHPSSTIVPMTVAAWLSIIFKWIAKRMR